MIWWPSVATAPSVARSFAFPGLNWPLGKKCDQGDKRTPTDELTCEPSLVVVAVLLEVEPLKGLVVNADLAETVRGVRHSRET